MQLEGIPWVCSCAQCQLSFCCSCFGEWKADGVWGGSFSLFVISVFSLKYHLRNKPTVLFKLYQSNSSEDILAQIEVISTFTVRSCNRRCLTSWAGSLHCCQTHFTCWAAVTKFGWVLKSHFHFELWVCPLSSLLCPSFIVSLWLRNCSLTAGMPETGNPS